MSTFVVALLFLVLVLFVVMTLLYRIVVVVVKFDVLLCSLSFGLLHFSNINFLVKYFDI